MGVNLAVRVAAPAELLPERLQGVAGIRADQAGLRGRTKESELQGSPRVLSRGPGV